MPQATFSKRTVERLVGSSLDSKQLEELLFRTKAEPVEMDGDELKIEVTHDRLDLLCESGIANLIRGLLHERPLGQLPKASDGPRLTVDIDASVAPLRGEIAMVNVRAPPQQPLDAELISELIRYQEVLHTSLGFDRKEGSLGLYPSRRLVPPYRYRLESLKGLRFDPLPLEDVPSGLMDGEEFYARHPMAIKYGVLGKDGNRALVLRDAEEHVLSLPPVLNAARYGEIAPGDTEVLIESTGRNPRTVRDFVGYMLLPFATRGWSAQEVFGVVAGGAESPTFSLSERKVSFTPESVDTLLGRRFERTTVRNALTAFGIPVSDRDTPWTATIPPWRPDLLGAVDLSEEVMIWEGLSNFVPEERGHPTRGRALAFSRYCEHLAEVMVGMGYQEIHTTLLISQEAARRFLPPNSYLELQNPVSEELSILRPSLLPTLMGAFEANNGHGYPQRIYEMGEVVVPEPGSQTGSQTRMNLGAAMAGGDAGFAALMALAERVLRVVGITVTKDAAEVPGTIRGRVAQLRFAGEVIGVVGEIHPESLAAFKVQEPIGWMEFDLSVLWQLKGEHPVGSTGTPPAGQATGT